jgi:putative spermidine/putrescine transport system permease protein
MASVTPLAGASTLAEGPPARRRGMQAGRRRRLNTFRYVAFLAFGLFFALPLYAMVRFSLEGTKPGTFSLSAWTQIPSYPGLLSAIEISLELGILTCLVILVLLVPTMIWIRLRVQWISRTVEFLCLLPLTIPAIVLVVGLAPIYNKIRHYNLSALQLFWVYAILALPYAYRALAAGLDAIDVKTMSEAARSLGASWFTVMWRVVAPNMRQALLNATLLSAALVLGEFTIASILLYTNLQVALYDISRSTAEAGVLFSTSAAALIFTFVLLLILSYAGRRRRGPGQPAMLPAGAVPEMKAEL